MMKLEDAINHVTGLKLHQPWAPPVRKGTRQLELDHCHPLSDTHTGTISSIMVRQGAGVEHLSVSDGALWLREVERVLIEQGCLTLAVRSVRKPIGLVVREGRGVGPIGQVAMDAGINLHTHLAIGLVGPSGAFTFEQLVKGANPSRTYPRTYV